MAGEGLMCSSEGREEEKKVQILDGHFAKRNGKILEGPILLKMI